MFNKFTSALIAGIIFGILIGITAALPCLILVSLFLMVILGAITVYLARGDIKNSADALIYSGLAGGISGIAGAVAATAWMTLIVVFAKYFNSEIFSIREISSLGIYGLVCAPVLIVSGVLLAAVGGFIYYEMVSEKMGITI